MQDLTKAIEIAVSRGFKFRKYGFVLHGAIEDVTSWCTYHLKIIPYAGISFHINLCFLIFGTDFVDKLVWEDEVCRTRECGSKPLNSSPVNCYKFKNINDCNDYISLANYHKQQLAILKTEEERIKYINGLAGV